MDSEPMTEQKTPITPPTSLTRSRVNFNSVQVFYFNRSQGFSCVPAKGGTTMGMMAKHSSFEEFHVDDYETKRRYERYHLLLRKYYNGKAALTPVQAKKLENLVRGLHSLASARRRLKRSGGLFLTNETGTSQVNTGSLQPDVPTHVEVSKDSREPNGSDIGDADFENEVSSLLDCCVLERLSIKKRKFLLQKSGLKQIDHNERVDCQAIRESREVCGCSCPDGVCLPAHCQCSLNNVVCQIDSVNFPCSCNQGSGCANPEGRLEFNQRRVRVHYIHTRMRLFTDGMCEQGAPAQVTSSPTGQEDNCYSLCNKEKRQRLEITSSQSEPLQSDRSPERSERPADGLPRFNSSTRGSCLLCDDPDFVEQCAKSFNIPSPPTLPLFPAASQLCLSPSAGYMPTNQEENGQLTEFAGSSTAAATFRHADDRPVTDPACLVDLGPPAVPCCDRSQACLLAVEGGLAHLTPGCNAGHPSACGEHLDVAYTETVTWSVPASREYSTDVPPIEAASRIPAPVLHGELSDRHTEFLPLAPITCLLPKFSPDTASVSEVCPSSPPDLSPAEAPAEPGDRELSPVTAVGCPEHSSAGGLTFSVMTEELRA